MWRVERTIAGVDASRDELLPYVGPAAALPLYGALARLPQPLAVRMWSGLLALSGGLIAIAALLLARTRRITALLAAFVVTMASGPGTSALVLGQAALISAAGIACALLAYAHRRYAAGTLATLIAGIQPNLVVALVARVRDRATLASAACAAVIFGVLTVLAGRGVAGITDYLHTLREHGTAERFVTIQHTPAAIARAFGISPNVAVTFGTAIAILAVLATAALIVRARLSARDGALLALTALPLAVPFFHEHDFVVEAIALVALGATARGRARVLAGVAAALVAVDWFGLAQRNEADAEIIAQGLAVAFAFVALGASRRATRADFAPLVAFLAVSCVAVPLARAHPAPTWPDLLPPAYRAPAFASASAVWAGEQRAAGLEAQEPAWGALRTIPVAGCIALGGAILLAGARRRGDEALAR